MTGKSVQTNSRRPADVRVVRLLLLLTAVAAAAWQCDGTEPGAIVKPTTTHPFIASVFPADDAIDVPLGSSIRVTFTRPMDTATITPRKFYFDGDDMYSLSRDSLKATICVSGGLKRCAEYHVVVDSGIADTAGNIMMTPYSFSFGTESGTPLISSVSPTNGQTDVPLDADITVSFNRDMDIATLNASTVLLSGGIGGGITYSERRLVFTPNNSLESYQTYTVTLKGTIADSAGAMLGQDFSWTFTTVKTGNDYIQSLFPVDGAILVPINTNIYIQFSVAINPSSVTPENFTVSGGVAGVVSVSGSYTSSVNFNPTMDLQSATSYTAAFHGDVTSTTGQTIYVNRAWTFTTRDTLPPQVVSVFPPDGAVNVPRATNVSITFGKDIAPASVSANEFYLIDDYIEHGQISVSANIVTLNPDIVLPYSKLVTAVFEGDVSDKYGHSAHIDQTWKFTTSPPFSLTSSYPASNEKCIPVDASIRMVFSRILDSTTVTAANFIFEEYNGSQLSGTLTCHDSVVEFRPNVPLTQLKEYQIKVFTGVEDISGENLPDPEAWRFTTRGENIWPLAIGNKWIYQTGTGFASIEIVGDTTIAGKHFFFDQSKRLYRYENDIIETTFRLLNPNFDPYKLSNSNCGGNPPQTIVTDSGTYLCQPFYREVYDFYFYQQKYYFAPSIGMIRFYQVTWAPPYTGEPTRYEVWELISYELH